MRGSRHTPPMTSRESGRSNLRSHEIGVSYVVGLAAWVNSSGLPVPALDHPNPSSRHRIRSWRNRRNIPTQKMKEPLIYLGIPRKQGPIALIKKKGIPVQ